MLDRVSRRELLASTAVAGTVATTGCLTGSLSAESDGAIRAPARTAVGDPVRIRLTAFEPETSVALDVVASDGRGRTFEGSWSLRTDDRGDAALATAAVTGNTPESTWYGSKHDGEVTGRPAVQMILHRLSARGPFASPPNFVVGEQNAVELAFRARSDLLGRTVARTAQSRVYVDPEISRRPVETEGVVGRLYTPSTPGPHPGVLTLHGAHAAVPHRLSRMLATHGYATLALRYFDAPGLPESLSEVPLEYFDAAVRWLTDRPDVRDDAIGLVGVSRGVEAALLTAVDYDGPATVVGYHGGGVVGHGVVGTPPLSFVARPAWTRNGTAVAEADPIGTVFDAIGGARQRRCGVESLPDSVRSHVSNEVLEQVLVRVEDIDGPVLLIAGADDRQWPSAPVAALTIDRLERRGHPGPYGLRTYCNAGHVFGVPYADYTGTPTSDENGGTPKANARAAADAWPLVLGYLRLGLTRGS